MYKILIFIFIFLLGEIIFNKTWYPYLKKYFNLNEENAQQNQNKILCLDLSTFKGVLERFIMMVGLTLGFTSILIVFGTIKLGTRFKDNQDIKNDYFLIGNFSSIIISILYFFFFNKFQSGTLIWFF